MLKRRIIGRSPSALPAAASIADQSLTGAHSCNARRLLLIVVVLVFECGNRLLDGQAKLGHQYGFLGALAQFAFPIAALLGVLVGERRRVTGKARGLRRRFLCRIDMLVPIP